MQKFAAVHPVISKIKHISDRDYLVHETLRFGFIPFSFTYPVTITLNKIEGKVLMRATVFKLTKIEMQFLLKAYGDYTFIEEKIHFKSPFPIKCMMRSIYRKLHKQLFKNTEME